MGGLPTNGTVNGFAVDTMNPKIMYVATRDGLFTSADAGETWKQLGKELKNPAAIALNPKNPKQIYISTAEGTIFVSADGGIKWKRHK